MNEEKCIINCLDVRVGKFVVCGPSKDTSVMPQMRQGRYEPRIQALFCGIVKEGMTVCDIGANFGQHTVLLSKLVGSKGKVYAIEASPINAAFVRRTIEANDCTNVEIIERGIWSHETKLTFSHVENAEATSFCSNKDDIRAIEPNPACKYGIISVSPLDDLVADDIDFIKMDIEGSELFAMKGSQKFLRGGSPVLIELNAFTYKTFTGVEIVEMIDYMQSYGYEYMYIYLHNQWLSTSRGMLLNMFANGYVLIDVLFSQKAYTSRQFFFNRKSN